jgi:predicted negative regulator of RcsB-dependent stress response
VEIDVDPYASENEQIELIKDWLKRNGMPILGGLCIGLGAIYGWRAWQSQVSTRADEASTAYEELLTHVAEHRSESAKRAARRLVENHQDSQYAAFAALMLARLAVEAGDIAKARDHLQWVLDHAGTELERIARLRLARLYLEEGKGVQAESVLERQGGAADSVLHKEIEGDVLLAQGKIEAARKAYREALAAAGAAGSDPSFVQMKLDEIGEAEGPRP